MSFIFETDHLFDRSLFLWNFNQACTFSFIFELVSEGDRSSKEAGSRSLVALYIHNTLSNAFSLCLTHSRQNCEKHPGMPVCENVAAHIQKVQRDFLLVELVQHR